MSDDLVKRARFVVQLFQECDAIQLPHKPTEEVLTGMADRIEELEATLLATCKREAATQARHDAKVTALEARADALAEQLAATNEKLKHIVDEYDSLPWGPVIRAIAPARATLAELSSVSCANTTGGKDEWKCPINYTGCTKNCGSYGCGN